MLEQLDIQTGKEIDKKKTIDILQYTQTLNKS